MKEIGAPTIMKKIWRSQFVSEAAELLELFQWKTAEEGIKQEERIKEELADVLIYSYMMADNLGFDLDKNYRRKVEEKCVEISNARKTSVETNESKNF